MVLAVVVTLVMKMATGGPSECQARFFVRAPAASKLGYVQS